MTPHTQKRPAMTGPGADEHTRRNARQHYSASPADTLLPFLDAVRTTGDGRWVARCPAHADRHPSLSVREVGDGTLLLRCWSGCSAGDVVSACGLELRDLFPRRLDGRGPLRRSERWISSDVLKCLAREALVVLVAAETLRRGEALSDEDTQRLAVAAGRLREASHG